MLFVAEGHPFPRADEAKPSFVRLKANNKEQAGVTSRPVRSEVMGSRGREEASGSMCECVKNQTAPRARLF